MCPILFTTKTRHSQELLDDACCFTTTRTCSQNGVSTGIKICLSLWCDFIFHTYGTRWLIAVCIYEGTVNLTSAPASILSRKKVFNICANSAFPGRHFHRSRATFCCSSSFKSCSPRPLIYASTFLIPSAFSLLISSYSHVPLVASCPA